MRGVPAGMTSGNGQLLATAATDERLHGQSFLELGARGYKVLNHGKEILSRLPGRSGAVIRHAR